MNASTSTSSTKAKDADAGDDDLYGFMNTSKPAKASKSAPTESVDDSKENGGDFLDGILDLSGTASEPPKNGKKQKRSKKEKDKAKKGAKDKNGVISEQQSEATSTLYEDEDVRITYTA